MLRKTFLYKINKRYSLEKRKVLNAHSYRNMKKISKKQILFIKFILKFKDFIFSNNGEQNIGYKIKEINMFKQLFAYMI